MGIAGSIRYYSFRLVASQVSLETSLTIARARLREVSQRGEPQRKISMCWLRLRSWKKLKKKAQKDTSTNEDDSDY